MNLGQRGLDKSEVSVGSRTGMTDNSHAPVSVIGLGAMGSALAREFLKKGHPTTIWNRSAEKAATLVKKGAIHAAKAADAITVSPLVVVCVLDYDAMYEIFDSVGNALSGRVLVNATSGTPEQAREAAAWAAQYGADYLDGAIMSGPEGVGQPEHLLLYSGSQDAFRVHQSTLTSLGAGTTYLGADPALVALYDAALLGLMWSTVSGWLHSAALLGTEGVDAKEFTPFAIRWLSTVTKIMPEFASQVDDRHYPGDESALGMQAAAMDHLIHVSRSRGISGDLISVIKNLSEQAIAAGYGDHSLTSLMEVIRKPPA